MPLVNDSQLPGSLFGWVFVNPMMENLGRKPRLTARQPTPQQARFIAEYLKCLDATQPARTADYSPKHAASIGCNLLKLPHVAEAVKKAMDARAKRTQISQDRVLKELARVAFLDIRATFDEAGPLRIDGPILTVDPGSSIRCFLTRK